MRKLKELLLESDDDVIKVGQVRTQGDLPLDSADGQIDGILLSLRAQAVKNIDSINESFEKMSVKGILLEEEGEAGEEEIASSKDIKDIGPTKSETVKINVDSFAKHIRAFTDTAMNQLDINSVIVNRARNIIKDKHPEAIEAFDEALAEVGLGPDPRYANSSDSSFQPGAIGGGGA